MKVLEGIFDIVRKDFYTVFLVLFALFLGFALFVLMIVKWIFF